MENPKNLTDNEIARKNKKTEFVRNAMPDNWLSYAEELGDVAEVVWDCVGDVMTVEGNTKIEGKMEITKLSFHARSISFLQALH